MPTTKKTATAKKTTTAKTAKASAKTAKAKKPAEKKSDNGLSPNQEATLKTLAAEGKNSDGLTRQELQAKTGNKTLGYPALIKLELVTANRYEGERNVYYLPTAKGRELAKKIK